MQYQYIKDFVQIGKDDIPLAGGKGANLGEMTQADFPVPPGFIITSLAYRTFLKENNLEKTIAGILKSANVNVQKELHSTAEKIQKEIKKNPIPDEIQKEIVKKYESMSGFLSDKFVAVRSSATAEDLPTASFAGQQETYLNVQGDAHLLQKVRDGWASLFTPRAVFYREEQKFNHFKVSIAMIVQEMVESEVSGIAFTQDPITEDKHKMVIEAVWGLGEYAVQGIVVPDRYEVERHTLKVLKIEKNEQEIQLVKVGKDNKERKVPSHRKNRQKLPADRIKMLSKILQKIHNHYFFPQDVEWAYRKGKFYIIQTRPITTLKIMPEKKQENNKFRGDGKELLKGLGASPGLATGIVKIILNPKNIWKIRTGDILVTKMTSPDFVPAMRKAVAIVTDEGGVTSHAAIVSRELGIPAIVGTKMATKILTDGMVVTVNAKTGVVFKGKPKESNIGNNSKIHNDEKEEKLEKQGQSLKTATKVYVNLAEPDLAKKVSELPVDGVGLLRAEFIMAQIGSHPRHMIAQARQEEFVGKLSTSISTFCSNFDPRPVVYRTSDFKTNEYRNLTGGRDFEPEEPNPMLGFRGATRYVADPDVFELELAAVKRVRGEYKNLYVMIPFVRSPQELLSVKRIMAGSGLMRSPTFKLWLMVELPVNVILLEDFIKVGIDGISIGSNDLTMLILGTDRDNTEVAQNFNATDPAVLWALERVIKICGKEGITSSICGQAPSQYDSLVEFLVEKGITSISVNPDSVGRVKKIIYETERKIVTRVKQ